MTEVWVLGAARTPIGRFGGAFRDVHAAELGGVAATAALERAGIKPADVGESIFGSARQAGIGPNVARQIAQRAQVPDESAAFTVNKACGSGLKALILGAQSILVGDNEVVLAGGTEAMSRVPYLVEGARWGKKMGHTELVDVMYRDGFMCPLCGQVMGETADALAREFGIAREEQDEFALQSQQKAGNAMQGGRFKPEIAPVRGVETDEHPRPDTTPESLAKLKPVFDKAGTVTAGNASGITDGASAVVLASADWAKKRGLKPFAVMRSYAVGGIAPARMGLGPVPALRKLFDKTGLGFDQVDLVELNEAFAAQVLACHAQLPLPMERLNVNGGAIALGHPVGATGSRMVTTLLYEMQRRNVRRGIATLCISGGLGLAALFEREAS
ncbi:MAG: thiolase family protein [Candidatus Xenobia bacterium]